MMKKGWTSLAEAIVCLPLAKVERLFENYFPDQWEYFGWIH